MNPSLGIAIYDPRRLSEADFLAGFVARTELAEFLISLLRKTKPDGEGDHRLVIGQRGMGKTSLLRRIAIELGRDEALKSVFIPLTFREEQYNVRTLDRFWRNCGESLAEWCETNGKPELAAELDKKVAGEDWRDPARTGEAFCAEMKKLGRRPVLFVDNLDIILDALPSDQHWVLRRILQARGGPILYAAATRQLSQSGDRNEAFYEFFHPHVLEPLTEADLLDCLRALANERGEPGKNVLQILGQEPERVRVLHTLTGGNPRVLTILYLLLERAESDNVFKDLEGLLDQMTPLYKARVEEYQTDLQRAIVDAIALNWNPITSHDLAKTTAVEVTTISSQLNRLKNDGLIEEVQVSGARAGYQFVERFFNIWYLMRHGTRRTKQKMLWLTKFLTSFYKPEELREIIQAEAIAGGRGTNVQYRAALESAYSQQVSRAWQSRWTKYENQKLTPVVAERTYLSAIESNSADAAAWNGLGYLYAYILHQPEQAIKAYRRAIEIDPKDTFPLHGLGRLYAYILDRPAEAEAAFQRSIEIDPQFADGWNGLGNLYNYVWSRPHEAETAYRCAIDLDPNYSFPHKNLGSLYLDHLCRYDDAEAAFRIAAKLADPDFSRPRADEGVAWVYLVTNRVIEARAFRNDVEKNLQPIALEILDAGIALAEDNLGSSIAHLETAIANDQFVLPRYSFFDDLYRLLRLFHARGYGEKLIEWFQQSGQADMQAPIYVAFFAYVRGERFLLDFNPEVRAPARRIYDWLASNRRAAEGAGSEAAAPRKRRGRPPKKRG